jgi:phosphatidylglycerol---prolipoprotein diacylglyceryl transferase
VSHFPRGIPESTAGYLRSIGDQIPAHIPDSTVIAVHPTQLYETILALVVFAILWRLGSARRLRVGQLFAAFLVLYATERFFIEFVRAKSDLLSVGGMALSTSQVLSLMFACIGFTLWFRQRNRAETPLETLRM